MRHILRLRTGGLPLEAVRVLLEPDQVIGELFGVDRMVAAALQKDPGLSVPLVSAGVLLPLPDGALQVLSPRAVLAAYMAGRPGATVVSMLRMVAESVLEVEPQARATLARIQQVMQQHLSGELDGDDLVGLSIEVLRLCLSRSMGAAGAGGGRPSLNQGTNQGNSVTASRPPPSRGDS